DVRPPRVRPADGAEAPAAAPAAAGASPPVAHVPPVGDAVVRLVAVADAGGRLAGSAPPAGDAVARPVAAADGAGRPAGNAPPAGDATARPVAAPDGAGRPAGLAPPVDDAAVRPVAAPGGAGRPAARARIVSGLAAARSAAVPCETPAARCPPGGSRLARLTEGRLGRRDAGSRAVEHPARRPRGGEGAWGARRHPLQGLFAFLALEVASGAMPRRGRWPMLRQLEAHPFGPRGRGNWLTPRRCGAWAAGCRLESDLRIGDGSRRLEAIV